MTVLDNLKEKRLSFSLRYFGKNDLDTPNTIKILIENYNYFIGLLSDSSVGIDEYILCLIKFKILHLKECIPLIIDEHNKRMIENLTKSIKEKETKGKLINFINNNISDIFKYGNLDLHNATLNVIKEYQNGIKDRVFEYLIKKERNYFLSNFKEFKKLKSDVKLLQEIICTNLSNTNNIVQIIDACSIISSYQNKDFVNLSNRTIDKIYLKYLELSKYDVGIKELFVLNDIGKALFFFFRNNKDSRGNKVRDMNKKLEKTMSDYIVKNGKEIRQEIPIREILESWISSKEPTLRMLKLTLGHENGKIKSRLSIESISDSLMDIISSNVPTDKYYTLSRQHMLESIANVGSAEFMGILQDEQYYTLFFNDFISLLSWVTKELGDIDDDILEEGRMLVLNVEVLIKNVLEKKDSEIIRQKTLSYNVEMLSCSLIESLLRLQYQVENKEFMYINFSNTTLGPLLDPESNKTSVFSKDHLSALRFFLVNSGENNDIGYNYRNKLAHLLHVYKNDLSLSKVCLLLYLLTDVLNTICIGLLKEREENSSSNQEDID